MAPTKAVPAMRWKAGAGFRRREFCIHDAYEANLDHPVASPDLSLPLSVSRLRVR